MENELAHLRGQLDDANHGREQMKQNARREEKKSASPVLHHPEKSSSPPKHRPDKNSEEFKLRYVLLCMELDRMSKHLPSGGGLRINVPSTYWKFLISLTA